MMNKRELSKFAKKHGWDEQAIAATRMHYMSHVQGLLDDPSTPFTPKKLFTISGTIGRVYAVATGYIEAEDEREGAEVLDRESWETIAAMAEEWEEGRLIIPLPLQSVTPGKYDDYGHLKVGGLKGFLKYKLPKREVETTDVDGNIVIYKVPAAAIRECEIRHCYEVCFEPLGVARLFQNGRRKATSSAVDSLIGLMILAEVIEQLISRLYCFEAVPAWHKAIRHDFNLLTDGDNYNRMPEEGYTTVEASIYEELIEAVIPSKKQDPVALFATGSKLAKTVMTYCCKRVFTEAEGAVKPVFDATIHVCGEAIRYARVGKYKVFTVADQLNAVVAAASGIVAPVVEAISEEAAAFGDWLEESLQEQGLGHLGGDRYGLTQLP